MGQFEAFVGVNFWTALFILLNTLIIFFVAKKFLFVPVMKIITDRQQEIDDMYTKAGEAKEQAAALRTEYEDKLSAASDKADLLVKEAVARGQRPAEGGVDEGARLQRLMEALKRSDADGAWKEVVGD